MHFVLQIVLGLVIADIAIAFLHWIEDTYFSYCMRVPVLSKIAKDNELHHYFPRDIVTYSYMENMAVTFPMAVVLLLVALALMPSVVMKYKYMFGTIFVITSTANIFHRFTHMRECELPVIIKIMQDAGILVGHTHHKLHHESSKSRYGVVMPVTNYALDGMGFWRGLEAIIRQASGVLPTRTMSYQDYVSVLQTTPLHDTNVMECPPRPTKTELGKLKTRLEDYYVCLK